MPAGALGLDLSFVRYIFLMEPLADASLEQQVCAGACWLGYTSYTHVHAQLGFFGSSRNLGLANTCKLQHYPVGGELLGTRAVRWLQ